MHEIFTFTPETFNFWYTEWYDRGWLLPVSIDCRGGTISILTQVDHVLNDLVLSGESCTSQALRFVYQNLSTMRKEQKMEE